MKRTVIKDLPQYLNQEVKVSGFVNARRDHGKLIFLDLRDQSGKIQMVSQPQNKKAYELADQLRPEWVAEVVGKVNKRPEKMINEAEANGHLELEISEIKILSKAETPPFDIYGEGKEINEEMRMKFRYLDLRRPRMQKNLQARHKVIKFLRDYLDSRGFLEVETPILTQ
ncbi:MAG: aspartyl-tRNA synthetase, partial [Parcubacteria group bacterium Gr01-1014_107]